MIGAISGALAMGYLVAAFFFLRYWTATRDRLFSFFSTAFFLLCIQRVLLLTFAENLWLYALRLLAFILILLAIADKNRK